MKIPVAEVLALVHSADHATLATQSQQMPGYPYATVVPCVVDAAHCPIFLISMLAEHTRNVLADARTSLSLVQADVANVQAGARLSMLGDCERFEPSPELVARYLRYQPDAAQYLALDFMFFRMQPKRVRFIAGVGRMGWLENEDWRGMAQIPLGDEAALLPALSQGLKHDVRVLGVDCYGIDCDVAGKRARRGFPGPALSSNEIAQAAALAVAVFR
jgi:hypothetical protein